MGVETTEIYTPSEEDQVRIVGQYGGSEQVTEVRYIRC